MPRFPKVTNPAAVEAVKRPPFGNCFNPKRPYSDPFAGFAATRLRQHLGGPPSSNQEAPRDNVPPLNDRRGARQAVCPHDYSSQTAESKIKYAGAESVLIVKSAAKALKKKKNNRSRVRKARLARQYRGAKA